jgi:acetoin utilization deacetylase AcuC-like enzyme
VALVNLFLHNLENVDMGKIVTFYTPKMSLLDNQANFSASPQKPRRLIEYLIKHDLIQYFDLKDFVPFVKDDFYTAHIPKWVDDSFDGTGKLAKRNLLGLKWSADFAETVKFTNASLYHAIRHSVLHPEITSFSPTSGFHHASPKTGALFCSFFGQIIASMKIYREFGLSGCYIDLDGHYGNSIDCSYDFVQELDKAIPKGIGNINIFKRHTEYLSRENSG